MTSKETKLELIEDLLDLFRPESRVIFHFAVQRPTYRHHYIAFGNSWNPELECCKIIHYGSRVGKPWTGEVKQEAYYSENFKNNIKSGLYLIENEKYPKNDTEYNQACDRVTERLQNKDRYSISENNCEHLVLYILIGTPTSNQVKEASWVTRWLIDGFELFRNAKNYIAAAVAGGARTISSIAYFRYISYQIKLMLENERRHLLKLQNVLAMIKKILKVEKYLSRNAESFIKNLESFSNLDRNSIVGCKNAMTCVKNAVQDSQKVIAVVSILAQCIVELCIAYCEISSLNDRRERTQISPEDCDREIKRVLFSCVFSICCSTTTLFIRDYSAPVTVFVEGFIGVMASHLFGAWFIDIITRLRDSSRIQN